MSRMIGLLVLLSAILALGGCAGTPYDYGAGYGYGYGYGGSCPQPYSGYPPVPIPMDPGYAVAPPAAVIVPQPQPYYVPQPYAYYDNGATNYAPAPPPAVAAEPFSHHGDHVAGPWIDRREREQGARIRQGLHDGSLTPREAQRLWGEQRHLRGAEGRMSADGNLGPGERGRLNAMQNRASQDIYRARHNGVVQPGAAGPHPGNGPLDTRHSMVQRGSSGPLGGNSHVSPMGSTSRSHSNGGQTQSQTRPSHPGGGADNSIATAPGR